jgi:thioredoxin-dependent peroxiredoxin
LSNLLDVGDLTPDFTPLSQAGEVVLVRDLVGCKGIVSHFYLDDHTSGCTAEARASPDGNEVFKDRCAEVIGESSEFDFHKGVASKHSLPFVLLSDDGGKVRELYGVTSTFGPAGRVTCFIAEGGKGRHIFPSRFNPKKQIEEALETSEKIPQTDVRAGFAPRVDQNGRSEGV